MNFQRIVSDLSQMKCDVHGKSANIALKEGKIAISNSCCNDFLKRLESAMDKEPDRMVDDKFNETQSETI